MVHYGERLRMLQSKIALKRHLNSRLSELRTQNRELTAKCRELDALRIQEQADVDKLQGRSLAAFFYALAGKKEEKLEREQQEAYAAAIKYDVAARELESVREELARCEAELGEISVLEKEYNELFQSAAEAIREAGDARAEELLALEQEIAQLRQKEKELAEAIAAGEGALRMTDDILKSLDSAKGWGTWDMIGGGIVADAVKHGHLDEAQNKIERLQLQLRRFKTELTDVHIKANIHIEIDSFLRFADYFFDGLFSAWAVMDKISEANRRVLETRGQIRNVLLRLESVHVQVQKELSGKKREREAHILNDN